MDIQRPEAETSRMPQDATNEPSNWIVLIGDIVRSRRAQNRAALQQTFVSQIRKIGRDWKPLAVEPDVTGGDEFKAVFRTAGDAWSFAETVQDAMRPVPLRFGIGFGALDSPPGLTSSVGRLNGASFHRAREALDEAKRTKKTYAFRGFTANSESWDDHFSLTASLIADLESSWTKKQRLYVDAYQRHRTYEPAAKELGVSIATVQGAVKRSRHVLLEKLKFTMTAFMDLHWRTT